MLISRPLTPPCVRFRTRRFLSFHKLSDNSQAWMYILTWLLFYLKRFDSALLPFSSNLFYCRQVLLLSNAQDRVLLTFGTLTCAAALSLTIALCDFCSSDQRSASTFLQIPLALIIIIAMNRTPLVLAVSFPLPGRIKDFHPLETCAARRTTKRSWRFFLHDLFFF